jgi:hypothetical protein
MEMSAEEAIRHLNKWKQDKSQLRLMLSMSFVSLSLLANGKIREASLADERLTVKIADWEFIFLPDDATFEYAEPREAQLSAIGLSEANCVCCLTVVFRDPLRRTPGLPDASLMFCERRGTT